MNEISVFDLKLILEKESDENIVIDVRRQDERDEGYIKGTTHIPLDDLPLKINMLKEKLENKNIYLQCRSGVRSANATTVFLQCGFNSVYNVKGGILEWQKSGFALVKD